jgi:ZIP family zinc transporter
MTFIVAYTGVTVTVGIMIHNIPEGIAIAIPCLAARPDQPWLSFLMASISGLAEPMGAFVALLCLRDVKGSKDGSLDGKREILNLENILSFVAGIMIMVALWELFPEAKRHAVKTQKYFWYGIICGIVIMVLTEVYLP